MHFIVMDIRAHHTSNYAEYYRNRITRGDRCWPSPVHQIRYAPLRLPEREGSNGVSVPAEYVIGRDGLVDVFRVVDGKRLTWNGEGWQDA
jgi:hypothetical protein